jgi:CRP-like cAMP-binding protein
MDDVHGVGSQIVTLLAAAGLNHKLVRLKAGDSFFAQGDPALCLFYLQSGRAKLTVFSKRGKEAIIMLLKAGDFIGEEVMANVASLRIASATAVTVCTAIKIERAAMGRILHDNDAFAEMFMKFLVLRGVRTQEDLVDQLFNSSEKRLARTLLLMADFGKPGGPENLIPPITQEALAVMIGTTRSRVSFFMNRFRDLGYIDYNYNGRIHVNKSLLSVVLHDQLPEQNSSGPTMVDPLHDPSERATRAKSVSTLKQR